MTDPAAEASALARLRRAAETLRIDWSRQASHEALFREHLRRMSLWATALGCEDRWPFFDVARQLFPDRFPDDAPAPSGLGSLGGAMRAALAAWVRFAGVAAAPEVSALGLADPYEPLVRLLERGGTFTTEHGMAYVGLVGIPRRPFRPAGAAAGLPLDDASLDALDAPGRAGRGPG
ncbi:hypothetical protein [Sorangium sp. So ce341]|uniref:hypothetical protein n=1 Tax=Sorangium sp. So ce341 TaxID=3133302 RepID=UPI003F5F24FF